MFIYLKFPDPMKNMWNVPIWVLIKLFELESEIIVKHEPIIYREVSQVNDDFWIIYTYFKFWDGFEYSEDFIRFVIYR